MNTLQSRLSACFLAVFPGLNPAAVASAAAGHTREWDSLALVTLISTIEEEFSLSIPPDDIDQFDSFARIAAYLEKRLR